MLPPEAADRIRALEPYMFAELERKIAEKKAAGIDVISLGIGDPDWPTNPHIVAHAQSALENPEHHQYPSNRGTERFRVAVEDFYDNRFGVELDSATEIVPVLGAKEGIHNICLAYLDHQDVALAADPGYPVYKTGPRLAGGDYVTMPLDPDIGFVPFLPDISSEDRKRAKLMFLNYPNNPTGAMAPEGFFDEVVAFARDNDILVVHDASYTETTFDGKVAPSFLASPGAKEVGVEFFSLSKGFNMTGWRVGALVGNAEAVGNYHRLKTNIDSGMFGAVQAAGAEALETYAGVAAMNDVYVRRRDLVVDALNRIGVQVEKPEATIYIWAPVPEGYNSASFAERVLEESGVVVSPGSGFGEYGEGFFRISLTAPDERIEEAVERIGKMENIT